jgi:hypothetical protein
MIISCNETVNLNCVAIGVTLTLSEQLFCNWHMILMHTSMPRVRLGKGPQNLEFATCLQLKIK